MTARLQINWHLADRHVPSSLIYSPNRHYSHRQRERVGARGGHASDRQQLQRTIKTSRPTVRNKTGNPTPLLSTYLHDCGLHLLLASGELVINLGCRFGLLFVTGAHLPPPVTGRATFYHVIICDDPVQYLLQAPCLQYIHTRLFETMSSSGIASALISVQVGLSSWAMDLSPIHFSHAHTHTPKK